MIPDHAPAECLSYLTIDDTPSRTTDALIDALRLRGIPAILFVRGDKTEIYGTESIERAIDQGFLIGNHAWTHRRASTLTVDDMLDEIDRTQDLIDACYTRCRMPVPHRLFRFPHLDRGAGGWALDFDAAPLQQRDTVYRLFADGVNAQMTPPTPDQVAHKARLQDVLRTRGYSAPFTGIAYPWAQMAEMRNAVDCLYTFSTADWMLLPRHRGRWLYKSLADLVRKIDTDRDLLDPSSRSILLAHDADDLLDVTLALIDHCRARGIRFVGV